MKKSTLFFLVLAFVACNNEDTSKIKIIDSSIVAIDKPAINDSLKSNVEKYYKIEKINLTDGSNQIRLYISDVSKVKEVNDFLIKKYNADKKNFISIYYFNKKEIGKTYLEKQLSDKISEAEKDRIFKYFIAVYTFNPSTGFDKLSFEH